MLYIIGGVDLTIFFPCYNDGPTIEGLVRAAGRAARGLGLDHEIVVVDDGSADAAPAVLERLQGELPELRVVRHPNNRGYGAAIRSGFGAARGELVFYTDGDGQYDPAELGVLFAALEDGVDAVNGWKRGRRDPWIRRVLGSLYRGVVRAGFGIRIRDPQCDFRLIRRRSLAGIELRSNSGAICVELVKSLENMGSRVREVPVTHFPRLYGRSRFFSPGRLAATVFELARLWPRLVAFPKR